MIDYVLNFAIIFLDYKVKGHPKFSNITKLCCHIYLIQYLIPKPNKKKWKITLFYPKLPPYSHNASSQTIYLPD